VTWGPVLAVCGVRTVSASFRNDSRCLCDLFYVLHFRCHYFFLYIIIMLINLVFLSFSFFLLMYSLFLEGGHAVHLPCM
jgi:hypothetical protein